MKNYTMDGMKCGRNPDFWKWFYVGEYQEHFLSHHPKRTTEDYIQHLEDTLQEFTSLENLEWANTKDDFDKWIVKHSKESLLVQIEGLKKAIEELKMEESK